MMLQTRQQTTTTMMMIKRRTTAESFSEVSPADGENVGADVGILVSENVGTGKGSGVGGSVGRGIGIAVGEGDGRVLGTAVGDGNGSMLGAAVGEGDGGVLGAGDGCDVGTGLGAGVGENVATSTESACALAIDSRRAARSPGALVPARRRRAAADWIAVVKLPSLTAAASVAITCECTLWSPLLSAYVLAMNASATRTSLVRVTPVLSAYSAHVASSNVEFERTASHASS